jgi:hypothetical protein
MDILKKTAMWTGIVLTGLCGVVLLGGGKVVSGTLLIAMAFTMVLSVRRPVRPAERRRLPRWVGGALICAVFGVVIWNISTTDLPAPSSGMGACNSASAEGAHSSTGIKFFDQVADIFDGFVSQADPS